MAEVGKMDRNLALEAVRVTEAAALAASKLMGRGDEKAADQAAVDAMRSALNTLSIDGTVVIGGGSAFAYSVNTTAGAGFGAAPITGGSCSTSTLASQIAALNISGGTLSPPIVTGVPQAANESARPTASTGRKYRCTAAPPNRTIPPS